jgi:hypothetical protein
MEKVKISSRGGARPGAGRPKGSGNKITAQDIIDEASLVVGKPLITSIMEGYSKSILENNNKLRVVYERMFLDKVIADRHQVETVESDDVIAAKQAAFAAALADLAGLKKD